MGTTIENAVAAAVEAVVVVATAFATNSFRPVERLMDQECVLVEGVIVSPSSEFDSCSQRLNTEGGTAGRGMDDRW